MAKKEPKRGMEAVLSKVEGKRKPALKRKGGVAIMIAVGKPRPSPDMADDRADEQAPMSPHKAINRALDRVKAPSDNESLLAELDDLNERVMKLEAALAKLEGHEGKDTEDDTEEAY